MDVLFVTNFCPHYRIGAFETLAKHFRMRFYFFSDATERYWERKNRTDGGDFESRRLSGFYLFPRFRVSLELVWRLFREDCDVIVKCTNGRFALPVTYAIAKLRRKHFILWQTVWYHPQSLFHRLSLPMLRRIWKGADAIVTYGVHGRRYLTVQGVDEKKIFIAWQAVDNGRFARAVTKREVLGLRQRLNLRNERIILYVGQLIPVKGLEYLIEAFGSLELRNVALLLVGSGPLEEDLKRKASFHASVHFVGYVEQEDLPVYYAAASVFVLPSVTLPDVKEAWGLVVNEAMNQGCVPVVTDAVGAGVGGLVENGENGLVVPERDAQALASAIQKVLLDPRIARRMRKAARACISKWTFERWAQGFVGAIEYATRADTP